MSIVDTVTVGPDTLKWIAGGAFAVFGGMFTLLAAIMRLAHSLGKDSQKIASGLEKLDKFESIIVDIPAIKVTIGQLEKQYEQNRSDIRELLREKRGNGSQPDSEEKESR
jgi:hypothetical protein